LNSVLVISGAFGVFHKETVVASGGYRTDVAGEDMELVVRLHRLLRRAGRPYRITFVPDPVCWTEAPESIPVLRRQRVRWQRGLCESLALNIDLMLGGSGGCVGWIAFPFALIFECLSPLVETAGYLVFVASLLAGRVDLAFALGFLVVSIGLGVLLSASSLLLDEMSFHTYSKGRHVVAHLVAAFAENFGYRQLNAIWRIEGLVRWAVGARQVWGEMTRSAAWSTDLISRTTSSWDRS
jgi:cellulose synthase/poly-beta-1,6-N-acetylglucosamine synthase-like glycosyltransferase